MYQFGPKRVEIAERTVTKDKVVTVVREVKSPDGTVIRDERTERDSRSDARVETSPAVKPDWLLGVSANPFKPGVYGGQVGRRILGNSYVTVSADTHGNLLLGVTILF